MKNLKTIIPAAVLAVALVLPIAVWTDRAQAGTDGATITYETVHQEAGIEWLFPLSNDQCRAVPKRLGAINPDSSDRVAQITRKVRANGSKEIDVFDVVTGTAAGSTSVNDTYIWIYENHAVYDVPGGAGPVKIKVRVFDRFRLIGNGFNLDIGFDWRWRFEAPSGSGFDPGLDFDGVAFPDDPEKPTNVLNFKAFSTQGEPLSCDPL
jgi:hypothetical protein